MIDYENHNKIFNKDTYLKFMDYIGKRKILLMKLILNYKLKGYKIIGIGAAAKANTFINYLGLNNHLIDFVTDASKHKIGKFTPLSRIPIYNDLKIKNIKKICVILFAWNMSETLKKN